MSDTPRTDEAYFPSWATMDTMKEEMEQLERELAVWKHEADLLREELAKADKALEDNISIFIDLREQRDRLAEASLFLADVAEKNTDDTDLWNAAIGKVRELAAVKGGRMSDKWETFCDECCYHMWCPRKIGQRGFNDGFHINNRDEAIALCDLLNNMERELAEARRSRAEVVEKYQAAVKEMHEAASQRDRLAEALQEALEDHAQAGCISIEAQEVAEAAIAAVKGDAP